MNCLESGEGLRFVIGDAADIRVCASRTRRALAAYAVSEEELSGVSTILTELGTNILKYAGRGVLSARLRSQDGKSSLEIQAEDNGPGIPDIEKAMTDHYSTGGSLGLGLPAVRRMSSSFSIRPGARGGTVVSAVRRLSSISPASARQHVPSGIPLRFDAAGQTRPMQGQRQSGDVFAVLQTERQVSALLADVTGHGAEAAKLAEEIAQSFTKLQGAEVRTALVALHERLRGTRGAAASVINFDLRGGTFEFAGIGNTQAQRLDGEDWVGLPRDGILGESRYQPRVQHGELAPGDVFVLWTDGVSQQGLRSFVRSHRGHCASHIAQQVVACLGKEHDDAGCLVVRFPP